MHNLPDLFRKYYYLLIFILLECVSGWLLFRFNSYQGSAWLSSANAMVAKINEVYSDCEAYIHLGDVNQNLTQVNIELQRENDRLRELLAQTNHDSLEMNLLLNHLSGYELIPAIVVGNSKGGSNNYLVINRGTNDGVLPEMGVVCGTGVVGIVYLTGPRFSLVMPVVNAKSSVSCRVQGQRYFGYLQWNGKNVRQAYVDDIPRYAKVKKGDVIETSGYSSVFPPGLFVGTINEISNSEDGQSFRLDVNLGTDFSNLRDVCVIKTPYKAEIDTLRAKAAEIDALIDS